MAMKTPGVYIVEKNAFPNSVVQVATAVPAFIGYTKKAINGTVSLRMKPKRITSLSEFHQYFGTDHKPMFDLVKYEEGIGKKPPLQPKGKADLPLLPRAPLQTKDEKKELKEVGNKAFALYSAMRMFFQNGGGACYVVSIGDYSDEITDDPMTNALEALKKETEPTMIVIPETTRLSRAKAASVQQAMLKHCGFEMKNRFAILDIFAGHLPQGGQDGNPVAEFRNDVGTNQLNFGAAYYPWMKASLYDGTDFNFTNLNPDSLKPFMKLLGESLDDDVDLSDEIALIGAPAVEGGMKISVNKGGTVPVTAKMLQAKDPDQPTTKDPKKPAPTPIYSVIVQPGSTGAGTFQVDKKDVTQFAQADIDASKVTFVHDKTASETEVTLSVSNATGNSTGKMTVEVGFVGAVIPLVEGDTPQTAIPVNVLEGLNADDLAAAKETLKLGGMDAQADTFPVEKVGTWAATDDGTITLTPVKTFKGPDANIAYEYTIGTKVVKGEAAVIYGEGPIEKRRGSPSVDAIDKMLRNNVTLYKEAMDALADYANSLPPSGAMAGLYTMVDNSRGVWKAPANISVNGVNAPLVNINHEEQENLNVSTTGKSINAIRPFVGEGTLVWGARTLDGNSLDWRYISVRRTMIMLEESIRLASKAYVFEPNTANTWITMKSMLENFLTGVWKQGGLAGTSAADAFSVHVGLGNTMTPEDILEGILKITVLVAVTRPAEFIEITFQQQMQKS